jgi:hypothetical protein
MIKKYIDLHIKYIDLHIKYPLFFSDFNETRIFLDRFFEKYSNTKFYENSSSGAVVVPCGQSAGHDEANISFSQFC